MLCANSYIIQLNYLTERTRHDLGIKKQAKIKPEQFPSKIIRIMQSWAHIPQAPAPVFALERFLKVSKGSCTNRDLKVCSLEESVSGRNLEHH